MAANSAIEWTGLTWNPVTGCRKISPGCKHCYAERIAKRLQAMPFFFKQWGGFHKKKAGRELQGTKWGQV